MLEVYKLYPQYKVQQDRRQSIIPVTFDRRSGIDRRSTDRIKLETNLTRDIFIVKGKISELRNNEKIGFMHKIPFAGKIFEMNNGNNQTKKDFKIQSDSKSMIKAGMIVGALATTMSSLFLGITGVVVAIGSGVYFGCKAVKQAISSQLKTKNARKTD